MPSVPYVKNFLNNLFLVYFLNHILHINIAYLHIENFLSFCFLKFLFIGLLGVFAQRTESLCVHVVGNSTSLGRRQCASHEKRSLVFTSRIVGRYRSLCSSRKVVGRQSIKNILYQDSVWYEQRQQTKSNQSKPSNQSCRIH